MDHRVFLKSLSAEDRQTLTAKSDLIGLVHLVVHWGAILILGTLIALRVPGWGALIVVQGVLLVFLFTLLHETVHQTPFRTQRLNSMVGQVCGFLLLLPAAWFRCFHFAHHRYTQDPENDPELAEGQPETPRAYILYVSGLPVWRSHIKTLIRNGLGRCEDVFVPPGKRSTVRREAQVMIAGYLCFAVAVAMFGISEFATVWLLPLLVGQPFLRLYLLAEHGRCPTVTNMFENTRTTFTSWIVRKLAWNMPFHAEHHTYPNVPFHRLPDLHQRTQQHLQETEEGYGRFNRKYVADLSS